MANSTAFDFSAEWRCSAISVLDRPHGWVVAQTIVLLAGASALLLVRVVDEKRRERTSERATAEDGAACVWVLDTTKLLCGQMLLGVINLSFTIELRATTAVASYGTVDLCCWYLVGVLVNTFVGMPLSYCGLRAVEIAGTKLEDSAWGQNIGAVATCGAAISQSGRYGEPPSCVTWVLQIATWMGVVAVANIVPIAAVEVIGPLHRVAGGLAKNLGSRTYGTIEAIMLGCVVILLTVAPLWMQYSFVRYQDGALWTLFGPVGGRRRRKSSENKQRLSSADLAKAAVAAAGGEVWWDSPVPERPPPPTPLSGHVGLAEPFLLSAPAAETSSPDGHVYDIVATSAAGTAVGTSPEGESKMSWETIASHCTKGTARPTGLFAVDQMAVAESSSSSSATAADHGGIGSRISRPSSLSGSRPISTPARMPRTVDVGEPGATPLQIQHIPARSGALLPSPGNTCASARDDSIGISVQERDQNLATAEYERVQPVVVADDENAVSTSKSVEDEYDTSPMLDQSVDVTFAVQAMDEPDLAKE